MICTASSFKGACKAYATNGNSYATRFKLPDLSNRFFKCDPGLPASTMKALSVMPFTNAVVEHNHGGQLNQYSDSIDVTLTNVGFNVRQTDTDDVT